MRRNTVKNNLDAFESRYFPSLNSTAVDVKLRKNNTERFVIRAPQATYRSLEANKFEDSFVKITFPLVHGRIAFDRELPLVWVWQILLTLWYQFAYNKIEAIASRIY